MSDWLILDAPLFEGNSGATEVPASRGVAIDGHVYPVEVAKCQHGLLPMLREDQDSGGTTSEATMSAKGFWVRQQQSWRRGAGQQWYDPFDLDDRANGGDHQRFAEGVGVDWDRDDGLSIAAWKTLATHDISNVNAMVLVQDRYLWLALANGCKVIDLNSPGSATSVTLTSATVAYSITSDDVTVWIGTDHGVYSGAATGTTATQFTSSTSAAQLVAYANGNLFAGQDNKVNQVSAAGAYTLIFTHPNTAFRWDSAAAGPNATYFVGHTGQFSQVYRTSINETTTVFSGFVEAAPMPVGERVRCLTLYAGTAIIGTSLGFRLGDLDQLGNIQYGPLIPVGNVASLAPLGGRVYFGWKPVTTYGYVAGTVGSLGLGFLLPGRQESQEGQPSWGPAWLGLSGSPSQVLAAASPSFVVVAGNVTNGLKILQPSVLDAAGITSAQLDTGWVNFGTPRPKQFLDVSIEHSPLVAGQSITVQAIKEDGNVVTLGVSNIPSTTTAVAPMSFGPVTANRYRLLFTITNDGVSPPPVLYRWEMRGYVVPRRGRLEILAVQLYHKVASGQDKKSEVTLDPYTEFLYLLGLANTGKVVLVQNGVDNYLARVANVQMDATEWHYAPDGSHRWHQGLCMVELHTI